MAEILLFGIGDFSILMKKYVERFSDHKVLGFVCHRQYRDALELESLPVYVMDEIVQACPPSKALVLLYWISSKNTLLCDVISKTSGFVRQSCE